MNSKLIDSNSNIFYKKYIKYKTKYINQTGGNEQQIAIFGGSFNPPTGETGHVGIIKKIVENGEFDQVWILPVYSHVFDKNKKLADYDLRVEMAECAFNSLSTDKCTVKVLREEKDAYDFYNPKSATGAKLVGVGTARVLKYLKLKYPTFIFSLVLGTDTFEDLIESNKWYFAEVVLENIAGFQIVTRSGTKSIEDIQNNFNANIRCILPHDFVLPPVHKVQTEPSNISSTELRERVPKMIERIETTGLTYPSPDYSCIAAENNINPDVLELIRKNWTIIKEKWFPK
jgi:nicotinate (nicotinamide) nucleotide adenylyltransferase